LREEKIVTKKIILELLQRTKQKINEAAEKKIGFDLLPALSQQEACSNTLKLLKKTKIKYILCKRKKKRGEGQIDCLQIATIGARICIYMYIYIRVNNNPICCAKRFSSTKS
jgi:hypothetical protein